MMYVINFGCEKKPHLGGVQSLPLSSLSLYVLE